MLINNYFFLRCILFLLLLTPSFNLVSGMPAFRVDDFLILLWLFFAIFYFKYSLNCIFKSRAIYIVLFLFYLPAVILNGVVNGYEGTVLDLNQYLRFLKYISFYWLSIIVFKGFSELDRKKLIDYFLLLGVVLFLILLSQFFDFLGMNKYYVEYIAPTQYYSLVNNAFQPRPVGMIGNPNELAYIMLVLSFLSLYSAFKFGSALYWSLFLLFVIGCFMTLSRGGVLSLLVGSFVFFFVCMLKMGLYKNVKIVLLVSVFLLLFSFAVTNDNIFEKIIWRFEIGLDVSNESSMGSRFDNWNENINIIKEHPFVGVGPLRRSEFKHASDNEWLLILRSYGVLGVFFILAFYLKGFFLKRKVKDVALYYAIVVSSFLYMIPAAIFHSLVLFPLVLFVFAFIDSESAGN